MGENSHRARFPNMSCALKDYRCKRGSRYCLGGLTQDECQMAFQHWVAFVRNALPDIFAQKHFICPMVGCERETFDNIHSCLQHVYTCPRLSDAWYWCPYCHEKENFTATVSESGQKKTIVERAVVFFKHFGSRRSSSRPETTLSPSSYKNGPFNRWIMSWVMKRRCRRAVGIEANPTYPQHCVELEDDSSEVLKGLFTDMPECLKQCEYRGELRGAPFTRSELMASPGLRSELEHPEPGAKPEKLNCTVWNVATESPNPKNLERASTDNITEEALTADIVAERLMESWIDIAADQDKPDYDELISPMSPELTLRESTFTPFAELVSPVSPIECCILPRSPRRGPVLSISTSFGYSGEKELAQDMDQKYDAYGQGRDNCSSDGSHPLWLTSNEGQKENLSLEADPPTAPTLIKDIRKIVHVLNDYWLQKLSSMPEFSSAKASFCATSPFERGLQALQSCCSGLQPTSFADVFLLAQFVFAFAYVLYQDDESYSWDELYEDVLEWRHAITNAEDRGLFSKVADSIWSPPGLPSALRQGLSDSHHPSLASLSAQSQDWLTSRSESSLSVEHVYGYVPHQFNSSLPPLKGVELDTSMLKMFKKGQAFSICCRFLDAVDYIGIANRNGNRSFHLSSKSQQFLDHVQRMKALIIVPLMQHPEMTEFYNAVMITYINLCDGILYSPHEIEVNLNMHGRLCYKSHQFYERFLTQVSCLCDNAMRQSAHNSMRPYDYNWRDRYYAMAIDNVQADLRLGIRQCSTRTFIGPEQYLDHAAALHKSGQRLTESSTNPPSSCDTSSTKSSLSAPNSTSTISDCVTSSASSDASTPFTTFAPSDASSTARFDSPTNADSTPSLPPSPTTIIARCEFCNTLFHGKFSQSNLKRHRRDTHLPHKRLACPEQGCDKDCSRNDNLKKHRKNVHGLVDNMIGRLRETRVGGRPQTRRADGRTP